MKPIRLLLIPPVLLGGFALSGCASAGQPMMAMKPAYARRQPARQASMFKAAAAEAPPPAPAVSVAAAETAPEPSPAVDAAPEPKPEPVKAPPPPRPLTRADKNEIDDQVMP